METRLLTVDEIATAVGWLVERRLESVGECPGIGALRENLRRIESQFFPFGGTIGVFGESGAMMAAGAVFWPVHGRIGFLGKMQSNPAGDPVSNAEALVVLARGMLQELKIHGAKLAVSMYDEKTLDDMVRACGRPAGESMTCHRSIMILEDIERWR